MSASSDEIEKAKKFPLSFIKLLGLKLEPWQEDLVRRLSIKDAKYIERPREPGKRVRP